MTQIKNLCVLIPVTLHAQVCEAKEAAEASVNPCEATGDEDEPQPPEEA
jgi:hypothetical protein